MVLQQKGTVMRFMSIGLALVFTSLGASGVVASAIPDDAGAGWTPGVFGPSGTSITGQAIAGIVWDRPEGAVLVAATGVAAIEGLGQPSVMAWDGLTWRALIGADGERLSGHAIGLAVFDDGTGPALYAGGSFSITGIEPPITGLSVARWDGQSWSPVGGAGGAQPDSTVLALAVHDDGSGPALYAGGAFTSVGGEPAARIARWDGAGWSPVGVGPAPGFDDFVVALESFPSPDGARLIASGSFAAADGRPAARIAQWDGTAWSALGSGLSEQVGSSWMDMAVFDDGSGPGLFVFGSFDSAGGVEGVNNIARWDGDGWSALSGSEGIGVDSTGSFVSLLVHDDGNGPRLFVGGSNLQAAGGMAMPARLAAWDGTEWDTFPPGSESPVPGYAGDIRGLASWPMSGGPALVGIGRFSSWFIQNHPASVFTPSIGWVPLTPSVDNGAIGLAPIDAGEVGGAALVVGGFFRSAGGMLMNNIGMWTPGVGWSALSGPAGTGLEGGVTLTHPNTIYAFDVVTREEDGGLAVYAGGSFEFAGGVPAWSVARWTPAHGWEPLSGPSGHGLVGLVTNLVFFDPGDGSGESLYAAGGFAATTEGVVVNNIARWDGNDWHPIVVDGHIGLPGGVSALGVVDLGTGPALYASGAFASAGGIAAQGIARWDGAVWSPLGDGLDGAADVIVPITDVSGTSLIAGGDFATAGGLPASNVARWDGRDWSALDRGLDGRVRGLAAVGPPSTVQLYAVGEFEFTNAGAFESPRIARFNGQRWRPVDGGIPGPGFSTTAYTAMVLDDGASLSPALYVGGFFDFVGDSAPIPSNGLGRLAPAMPFDPCPGDLNNDGFVDSIDLAELLAAFGDHSEGDLDFNGVTDSDDLTILLSQFGLVCRN
ncbi:MAG: hypothetical protein ACTS3F_02975 [Phycisphaerales bacterium]